MNLNQRINVQIINLRKVTLGHGPTCNSSTVMLTQYYGNSIFFQDNARPHTAARTLAKIEDLGWKLLTHPPYSPDLAPSDFHLFGPLKESMRGIHFQ